MENAVIINPNDSVVTVTEQITKGGEVRYPGCAKPIVATQDIPMYHKIAIAAVKQGQNVLRYGERFGVASKDINIGDHVHVHNVNSVRAV